MAITKFYSGHTNGEIWENDSENPTEVQRLICDMFEGDAALGVAELLNSAYLEGYKDGAITVEVRETSKRASSTADQSLMDAVLEAFVQMYNFNAQDTTPVELTESEQKVVAVSTKLWDLFDSFYGKSWRKRLSDYAPPVTVN